MIWITHISNLKPIDNTTDDKKLRSAIDARNSAVEKLQETTQAISRPPDITDDESLQLTTGDVYTHREARFSEQLKLRQDTVRIKHGDVELCERIEVKEKHRADESDSKYDSTHDRVAKGLKKVGRGPESTPGGKIGSLRIAERQFEQSILQSADVQNALAEKKEARGKLAHAIRQTEQARADLIAAQASLRDFIITIITRGFSNEQETTSHPGRTPRKVSRFQKV